MVLALVKVEVVESEPGMAPASDRAQSAAMAGA